MTIQQNAENVFNIYSIQVILQQRLSVATKMYLLDVRIHHRICVVLEHLLHTLVKLNETIVGEQIINVTIQQNAENVFNIYSIQVSLQQRPSVASKHIISTCENSSHNLCCFRTSTSHTCYTERNDCWRPYNKCDNSTE